MGSNWSTKRSYVSCSAARAVIVLATPVLPPEASEQAKSGRFVPGGVGGVTAADGSIEGPQAPRIEIRMAANVRRTGQWYGREPSDERSRSRRGGGTGRRVGLKNRCPQGRAGSTPALGTTPRFNDWGRLGGYGEGTIPGMTYASIIATTPTRVVRLRL